MKPEPITVPVTLEVDTLALADQLHNINDELLRAVQHLQAAVDACLAIERERSS